MKISFSERIIEINDSSKLVNFDNSIKLTKSLNSKINVLILKNLYQNDHILICIDIIWISSRISEYLRSFIAKKYKIQKHNISICSSHTHGSLNTDENFKHGEYSINFNNYLIKNIIALIEEAYNNHENEIYCEIITKNIDKVSVNRRKLAPNYLSRMIRGEIGFWAQNLPNENKFKDNKLVSINFINKQNNKIIAILLKFTCHPVADPISCEGADFPGYVKEYLSNNFIEKPIIFFLQGFAGDVRPNLIYKPKTTKDHIIKLIIGNRFRNSNKDDSKIIAQEIVKQIKDEYKKDNKKIENIKIESYSKNINILNNNNDHNKILNLTLWDFNQFKLCFLSGEILSGYALKFKNKKNIIGIGYSNGMTGYIPTENDLILGGYEVDKSRYKFNLDDRISIKFIKNFNKILSRL